MASARHHSRVRHHGVPAGGQLLGEGRQASDQRRVVETSRRGVRRYTAQADTESARPRHRRRRLRRLHVRRFQLARQSPESHDAVRCVAARHFILAIVAV